MKISFDFDSTLSKTHVQKFAKLLIPNHEVVITTSRRTNGYGVLFDNSDLFEVADSLGIKDITFTEGEFKAHFLVKNNIHLHIDDDPFELTEIQKTKVIPVSVINLNWQQQVLKNLED